MRPEQPRGLTSIIELAMVLQRHCKVDPAITRAERYVCQDPSRFQAARRGWMGERNRSVPAGYSPATPTEVRSVECFLYCAFFILPGYHDIERSHIFLIEIMLFCTQSNDPAHTLFLSQYCVFIIVSICLPPSIPLLTIFPASYRFDSLPPQPPRGSLSCRL